jgi:catalase
MPEPSPSPARSTFGSLVLIAVVIGGGAAAFGPSLGHRRNHAKGICFTGVGKE